MSPRRFALLLLLLALAACSGGHEEVVQPLDRLDFRPTAEFGFNALLTGLRLGKQVVDERAGDDEAMRAQGYRYLFRQVEMNLANLTADNDPAHPTISRCPSKNCKLGFDNPDYSYIGVMPLSADHHYRLSGSRGSAALLLFQVLERSDGPFKGTSKTDSQHMAFGADGSWVIYLGRERPEGVPQGNFLPLGADQATLLVRIAHNDWRHTVEPSVAIEVLDPVDEVVAPFTPMRMAVAGFALSKMIPNQLARWVKRLDEAPLNGVDTPCRSWGNHCAEDGGFGNFSTGGRYKLAPGEALVITAPAIDAVYQAIQLGNVWAESLDYASRQSSLNGYQAHRDSDGRYRYVLAHEDPGVPNWLDISGYEEGSLFLRWVMTDGAAPARPTAEVVPLAELREHLPADTPTVTRAERAAVLKERLAAVNRRMNPAGTVPGEG